MPVAFLLTTVGIITSLRGFHGRSLILIALGNGLSLLHLVLTDGRPVYAAVNAAALAWALWLWWNGGGGDGTRRRLRRLAGRFQGVRRTAPAA
jgi:hypothetical protein